MICRVLFYGSKELYQFNWEGCGLAPVIDRLRPIGYGRKAVLCLQENGEAVHVILVNRYADDVERFFDCDCIYLVGGVVIVSLMWLPKDTFQHGSVAKLLLLKGRLLRE